MTQVCRAPRSRPSASRLDDSETRRLFADRRYLTKDFVDLAMVSYATAVSSLADPLVSVPHTEKLPPTGWRRPSS